jgi:ureidoacrylate peracid hydrolase
MKLPLRLTLEEKVDPSRSCLLVIDMQNDFCSPDGYWGQVGNDRSELVAMMPRLHALISSARAAGTLVIFVKAIYDNHYLSAPWLERNVRRKLEFSRCQAGTWGADFFEVKPEPNDLVVVKHRYSAFIGTELDVILNAHGIETIVLAGVATNICVESTARDGFMLDYYVVVVDDCTAAKTVAAHEASLASINDGFGVVSTGEGVMEAWARAAGTSTTIAR